MENNILKAYKFFKAENPSFLLLFRIHDNYEAFEEDARLLASVATLPVENQQVGQNTILKVAFSFKEIRHYLSLLKEKEIAIKTITSLNSSGEYDMPDVDQILSDREADY